MSDVISPVFGKPKPAAKIETDLRREVVPFLFQGATLWRANVWVNGVLSSKTFATAAEAHAWISHGAKK